MNTNSSAIEIAFADENDRERIYAIRHQVYASELGQHPENGNNQLSDKLDAVNCYIVAKYFGHIVGFVSITPPNSTGYSIDKYFNRGELPLVFDERLFEIRLLTVTRQMRGNNIGAMLYYGALCYILSQKGQTIVAIGRLEVLDVYLKVGMKSLGLKVCSGKVTYELLCANANDLKKVLRLQKVFSFIEQRVIWKLNGVNFLNFDSCYHGGESFEAIGDEFNELQNKDEVINADVLDAWFDPAPGVLEAIYSHLAWSLKTSPPTASEGMRRKLAVSRGVQNDNILPGAGSSDLIFLGLRHWLNKDSRVLILDPMYGEYAHVLENVIGCNVDRLSLERSNNYRINESTLVSCLKSNYDWVILVNPNSPTGQYFNNVKLQSILETAPKMTHFWIDETYLEFVDPGSSLEQFSTKSDRIIICKSMSKVYALSGVRSAYLCGSAHLINELQNISPPWSVSLPGQIAACEALRNISYYKEKWDETSTLRESLAVQLQNLGWDVIPGCANFLLCHLPKDQPEAKHLISACKKHKLYLRNVGNMGTHFDNRTLRIAIKNKQTNDAMIRILRLTLNELHQKLYSQVFT
jgi:histidinol-phosphate/aromatic aminotransferase/cobyric acid decarboxylase-like protein